MEDVKAAVKKVGLSEDAAASIAVELASKYNLSAKAGGSPAELSEHAGYAARTIAGRPRATAHAVKLGGNGWLVWLELADKTGTAVERLGPVVLPGDIADPFA